MTIQLWFLLVYKRDLFWSFMLNIKFYTPPSNITKSSLFLLFKKISVNITLVGRQKKKNINENFSPITSNTLRFLK